jgi:hypothetical protein
MGTIFTGRSPWPVIPAGAGGLAAEAEATGHAANEAASATAINKRVDLIDPALSVRRQITDNLVLSAYSG